jgi:dihydroorotase
MKKATPFGFAFGFVLSILAAVAGAAEPPYDLLIRGGRVIDPKNAIDGPMDVAIAGDRVVKVAPRIPAGDAKRSVDATGRIVTPGLVDIHVHVFHGTEPNAYLSNGFDALPPDGFTLRTCVTTAVDAGGAGWRNVAQFKDQVVDRAKTRVLAWLNIVGTGMKGGAAEQNPGDLEAQPAAQAIRDYKDFVIGVKTAHFKGGWAAVDHAVQAAGMAGVPVMVDFGDFKPELSLEDLLLHRLRPGDVFTHVYAKIEGRTSVIGDDGKLQPYLIEARRRGLLFDVGHGGGSFVYAQAEPAFAQGFPPDTISTDLHSTSMNGGMKDLPNVMSKLLNMGLSVADVVAGATSAPARTILCPELGQLGVGSPADVAVLSLRDGSFGYVDVDGVKRLGRRRLECEVTVRGGQVAWDQNGLSRPNP